MAEHAAEAFDGHAVGEGDGRGEGVAGDVRREGLGEAEAPLDGVELLDGLLVAYIRDGTAVASLELANTNTS